ASSREAAVRLGLSAPRRNPFSTKESRWRGANDSTRGRVRSPNLNRRGSFLGSGYDWHIEHAGVFSIVQNSDMRGVRILRSFVCHHAARVIIFLEVYRVGRADDEPESAAFGHSPGNEQTGIEIAAHNFACFDQLLLSNRLAVTQASDIAPKRDAGSIGQNFIKLGCDIGVRNAGG